MSLIPKLGSSGNGPDKADRAVPIACSLSSEEARDRVARWNNLVLEAKTAARSKAGLVQAEFRNEAAVRKELELLVAAERECCPFLQFDLSETETAVALTLTSLNASANEDLAMLAPALGIAQA
jgi:hypothetical protein